MQAIFDVDWRAQALAGEAQAVEALARGALAPLYRFCFYRVGRDIHLCQDVVQETMLRAIRDLHLYDPARCGNDIFGWLTGLARNEIRRVLAHNHSAASLEALWSKMDKELLKLFADLESQPLAEDVLMRQETRELVNATMSQLPPHYGEALEAKYLHGKSVRDMAGSLRLTEKAVESLLTRARGAFRATFAALTRNLDPEIR